ncbi:MAG: AraC family transcriptional regulator [Lachnospiraceae bacterium]
MEKVTFYGEMEGISLEQMVRFNKFDMRVKHFHPQYEIFYIVEGKRVFFFNNREYLAQSGDLILINSNLIHMTKSLSNSNEGHNRIILYVTKEKMCAFDEKFPSLHLVQFFDNYYGVYHLNAEQQALFLNMTNYVRHAFTNKGHDFKTGIELEVLSYLFKMKQYVQKHYKEMLPVRETFKYPIVYDIADYLSAHYEENISLDQLCDQFYLSKSYICRIFKEATGYTISEFINIHRIRKAQRYLEETDLTIAEIAHKLGYESTTYFERLFKNYNTLSPLKYRKTKNTVTYTNQLTTAPLEEGLTSSDERLTETNP